MFDAEVIARKIKKEKKIMRLTESRPKGEEVTNERKRDSKRGVRDNKSRDRSSRLTDDNKGELSGEFLVEEIMEEKKR